MKHDYEEVWERGVYKAVCKACGHTNEYFTKVHSGCLEGYVADMDGCPKQDEAF